jgi:hypothetical protein
LRAVAHESSAAMARVLVRKPHAAHCVPNSHSVGRKAPLPPSRQRASSRDVSGRTHELPHSVKGACGGRGGEGVE